MEVFAPSAIKRLNPAAAEWDGGFHLRGRNGCWGRGSCLSSSPQLSHIGRFLLAASQLPPPEHRSRQLLCRTRQRAQTAPGKASFTFQASSMGEMSCRKQPPV